MTQPSHERLFTADGAWLGGFYQLNFFYPEGTDLVAVLRALWSYPRLWGPVASRTEEPWDQARVAPAVRPGESVGVLSLPGGGGSMRHLGLDVTRRV